jgi:hypothetical protein
MKPPGSGNPGNDKGKVCVCLSIANAHKLIDDHRKPKPSKKRRRVEDSSDDEIEEYALVYVDCSILLTAVSGYKPLPHPGPSRTLVTVNIL